MGVCWSSDVVRVVNNTDHAYMLIVCSADVAASAFIDSNVRYQMLFVAPHDHSDFHMHSNVPTYLIMYDFKNAEVVLYKRIQKGGKIEFGPNTKMNLAPQHVENIKKACTQKAIAAQSTGIFDDGPKT